MISDTEQKALDNIENRIVTKGVSNDFLVQLIILGSEYLNLQSIPEYARRKGKTYRGVKNSRDTIEILGKTWIIDNN